MFHKAVEGAPQGHQAQGFVGMCVGNGAGQDAMLDIPPLCHAALLQPAPHRILGLEIFIGGVQHALRAVQPCALPQQASLQGPGQNAVALEQQSRVVRSEEMIDNLLAELHAKAEAEGESCTVDTARRIAELHEQREDWENATNWFNYAASLSNNSDMALVRKASDLQIRQFDLAIDAREQFIEANPGTPESEGYAAELESLKKQRADLALEAARSRVDQNPTDLQLRFELGEILVDLENWQEAIPELQKARQNPNVRMRAMSLLGQCFTARGMLDLAAKTLSDAVAELLVMDAVKKDVIYNLGLVYEKMGDAQKTVDCMKQIYEVDYGYRDVAKRVESSY